MNLVKRFTKILHDFQHWWENVEICLYILDAYFLSDWPTMAFSVACISRCNIHLEEGHREGNSLPGNKF